LFSGALLMLPSGSPVPAGYAFVGTFELNPISGPRSSTLVVDVYRKQ
jgi:hypothetical protein